MPREPTPPKRPTVPPACIPRVRSVHWLKRYAAVQTRRPAQRGSLARTSSATASAATATRSVTAIATLGTLTALSAFSFRLGANRGQRLWFTASLFPPSASRLSFRLRRQRFHRQTQTSALVAIEKLDLHAVTLLHDVFSLLGATVLQLGDVHQTFSARHDLDERAESSRALDVAFVRLADDGLGGERLNHLTRSLHRLATNGGDRDQSGIVDRDLGAGLFLDAADRLALRSDEIADLLRIDIHRHDARSILRQIAARLGERLRHFAEDMEPALARLRQRFLHDLEAQSFDLDVHLDRSDAVL